MEEPEFHQNAGIYVLTWHAISLKIRMDRLRVGRADALSAEITVQSKLGEKPLIIHQARLNLTSTSARSTLIRHLSERFQGMDWTGIIETACVRVLENHRMGEPLIDIMTVEPSSEIKYLCDPLIMEDKANMFYGAGGSGKSMLATYLAALIMTGHSDTNTRLSGNQGTLLYLDYESDEEDISDRVHKFLQYLGECPRNNAFLYRFCSQRLSDEIEEIQRMVVENDVSCVVIDSVGIACGDVMEPGPVIEYFRALRSLRVTTLSIDHIKKNQDSSVATPFGSIYKLNLVRSAWEICSVADRTDNETVVAMYHRKVNRGFIKEPIVLKFQATDEGMAVSRADPAEYEDVSKKLPIWKQIRNFLHNMNGVKQNTSEIANAIGLTDKEDSIRTILNKYSKLGIFVKFDNGWVLGTTQKE